MSKKSTRINKDCDLKLTVLEIILSGCFFLGGGCICNFYPSEIFHLSGKTFEVVPIFLKIENENTKHTFFLNFSQSSYIVLNQAIFNKHH